MTWFPTLKEHLQHLVPSWSGWFSSRMSHAVLNRYIHPIIPCFTNYSLGEHPSYIYVFLQGAKKGSFSSFLCFSSCLFSCFFSFRHLPFPLPTFLSFSFVIFLLIRAVHASICRQCMMSSLWTSVCDDMFTQTFVPCKPPEQLSFLSGCRTSLSLVAHQADFAHVVFGLQQYMLV